MGISSIQKIIKIGKNSAFITVPKRIMEIKDIKYGDYIEVVWGELHKSEKTKTIKKKKTKKKDNRINNKNHDEDDNKDTEKEEDLPTL